jgi:hypothetical protein
MVKPFKTSNKTTLEIKTPTYYIPPQPIASALAASVQLQAAAFSQAKGSRAKSKLQSIATRLNRLVEAAIIKELGGGKIKAGTGAFYPDWVKDTTDEGDFTAAERTKGYSASEVKLIGTTESDGQFTRGSRVGVGGGAGITLKTGEQQVVTGFNKQFDENGKVIGLDPKYEKINTTAFVRALQASAGDSAALLKVINGRDQAARAIKSTLLLKASSIDIPVQFQGALYNKNIKFTWREIQAAVRARKMQFTAVTNPKKPNQVKFNLYFSAGTITKALNAMSITIAKQLQGSLGRELLQDIANISAKLTIKNRDQLRQILSDRGFTHGLQYIVGSAIISRGVANIKSSKAAAKPKATKTQSFLSSIQWTALVQNQLRKSMRKSGKPRQPNLTERSGRFRESVTVVPNYRSNLVSYYYLPLYSHLQNYGYEPEQQIIRSIREVAQKTYARQFNIQRM